MIIILSLSCTSCRKVGLKLCYDVPFKEHNIKDKVLEQTGVDKCVVFDWKTEQTTLFQLVQNFPKLDVDVEDLSITLDPSD